MDDETRNTLILLNSIFVLGCSIAAIIIFIISRIRG